MPTKPRGGSNGRTACPTAAIARRTPSTFCAARLSGTTTLPLERRREELLDKGAQGPTSDRTAEHQRRRDAGAPQTGDKRRHAPMMGWTQPCCRVAMEACASGHYWARAIGELGHEVGLIPPAYVKPFIKRQKNDMADAEAICEAPSCAGPSARVSRPAPGLRACSRASRRCW